MGPLDSSRLSSAAVGVSYQVAPQAQVSVWKRSVCWSLAR